MNAVDHYAVVLADLEAQRAHIDIAIAAIRALRRPATPGVLHLNSIDEEGESPSGPPPKPFASRIETPSDPELLKATANRLLDSGMSMNEVTRELSLTPEQTTSIFYGA